jgi:hypothetical protein
MSLTDDKLTARRALGALRKDSGRAVVEVEARVSELVAADTADGRAFCEETRNVDLLEIIRAGSSVSQAAEDLAAIQTMIPAATAANTGRVGIAIIRALLGV